MARIAFEDISVSGKVYLNGTAGSRITEIENADLKAEGSILEAIPLNDLRVHDAFQTVLPTTSSADDLGLYPGTFATSAPMVQTSDLKNAGSTTCYARFLCTVPPRYEPAGSFKIRFYAGMETTAASSAATIDLEAYKVDGEGGISADLCATAATSINSTSYANHIDGGRCARLQNCRAGQRLRDGNRCHRVDRQDLQGSDNEGLSRCC
jgi:hypothetical protein